MKNAQINDVVQIIEGDWTGSLAYVIDVCSWGVEAFVYIPNKGKAFVRINHDEYAVIGKSYLDID